MHVKYVCVFVYKCMYVGGYVHVCVWECVCVCVCVCMCVRVWEYVCPINFLRLRMGYLCRKGWMFFFGGGYIYFMGSGSSLLSEKWLLFMLMNLIKLSWLLCVFFPCLRKLSVVCLTLFWVILNTADMMVVCWCCCHSCWPARNHGNTASCASSLLHVSLTTDGLCCCCFVSVS